MPLFRCVLRHNCFRYYQLSTRQSYSEIISTPHVQQAIIELAEEAKQQTAAGEIEEGGFAIE
jgi:hypothetical protein